GRTLRRWPNPEGERRIAPTTTGQRWNVSRPSRRGAGFPVSCRGGGSASRDRQGGGSTAPAPWDSASMISEARRIAKRAAPHVARERLCLPKQLTSTRAE